TSVSFDISVLEILGSLCHGRKLVLLGEALGTLEDSRYSIPALIERHAVTHFQCTPSQARMLLRSESGRRALGSLRQLLLGGEALSQDLADELGSLDVADVFNLYGPTETTVWSTTSRVEPGERVNIGRPIANTCLFVLDPSQKPVPLGAVGELYIGGPGVTRGYLNQPELSAERFVPNRLRPALGDRLYRTGDLVRYRADGSILHLGRNDHQVKVRGHRIELGEIESAIGKLRGVTDAVVVARGEAEGQRLVAYVVSNGAFNGDDALRAALRKQLPDFMLPTALVHLDALPLTPNGKVDRSSLPEPPAAQSLALTYAAPSNARESKLCEIWQRALSVPRVGRADDFFALGGHSLLAVKISNEVEKAFALRLPLTTLFECPTVESFAKRLAELEAERAGGQSAHFIALVPIQPRGSLPPFYCVAGLGGNPMNLRHLAQALGSDQPFYGLQLRGVDGRHRPHRRVQAMAEEFLAELRAQQAHGPYYLGGYSFGGLAAYEMAQMLEQQGERIALLVLLDTMNPVLPNWTMRQRFAAHFDNLRQHGPAYFANRVLARLAAEVARRKRTLRARLANRYQFEFRNDAVWVASEQAMAQYRPAPYDGDVLLVQAEGALAADDGIGLRPHESNGWRDLVRGHLEIVSVSASHIDVVSEQASPLTAQALQRALADARQRSSETDVLESSPSSSGEHRRHLPASHHFEEVA
ncbi:MAG TPA: alpha/beta fold hydrolase, partial [Polyangiaceae bacterium]|nr:alpha/beta fold hydrolase [Polyangiaceae bacterium]